MRRAGKLVILLGVLLVLCGLVVMLYLHFTSSNAELEATQILTKLKEVLPPESIGAPGEYSSDMMPALSVDERDIIALLTIPSSSTELAVAGDWDSSKLISLPQRFSGSCYNNSLIIGGYDREEQLGCLKELDIGYEVFVTDMTGAKFSYRVTKIERKKSVENEVLTDTESHLTLFTCDSQTSDYIIVRCESGSV